jgi:hypothetical protein
MSHPRALKRGSMKSWRIQSSFVGSSEISDRVGMKTLYEFEDLIRSSHQIPPPKLLNLGVICLLGRERLNLPRSRRDKKTALQDAL